MPTSSFGSGNTSGQISNALGTAEAQLFQLTNVMTAASMALMGLGVVVVFWGIITGRPNWALAGILGVIGYAASFFA